MNLGKVTVKIENNFTVIPNEIIRNKDIASSTKNILLTMLSLPRDWNFSISGLVSCVREGAETIRKALVELEKIGYITRTRERKENGTLGGMMYTVYQYPVSKAENTYKKNFADQNVKKPTLEENPQLNKDYKTNKENKGIYVSPFIPLTEKQEEDVQYDTDKESNPDHMKQNNSDQKKKRPPYNYTLSQIKGFLRWKIPELMAKEFPDETENHANFLTETITGFYANYMAYQGKRHPIMSDSAYIKILGKFLNPIEEIKSIGKQFCSDIYMQMMEMFFRTNYGEISGNTTDYHLPYFLSPAIQERLYSKVIYPCNQNSPFWVKRDEFIERRRLEYAESQRLDCQST